MQNIDIVYGDIKQFQFDTLRTEFMGLGTRSGRPYDDVIIDEVDSILLDEGSKLAMLSTAFTGMDKLEPIYHIIRSKLVQFDSEQTYYCRDGAFYHNDARTLENTPDLEMPRRKYLKQSLEEFIHNLLGINPKKVEKRSAVEYFQLPPHLLKFVKSQVSNWAEAAITAEALEENKDYLLVDNKIVPIDPHNGTLQPSSNWNNGLHQFLQIKHEVEFTPESPTTNYLSNWAMVQKYKREAIGLTGTLGSSESFKLLSEHMSADCISIPDLHPSRFVQFPSTRVRTRQEWRDAIMYSTESETSYDRAVLVICQTVKEARSVYSDLLTEAKFSVKLHVRSDIWMDHHLQRIQPRDVIVTTTLGTRGMHIQASAIEEAGGLHVILAYMPPNTRIVKQAFGRTSRKGNAGSGEFIIKRKYGTLEPTDVMEHIKKSELNSLERYFEHELPLITSRDETFSDFLVRYSTTRQEVKRLRFCDENLTEDQVMDVVWKNGEVSGTSYIILEAIQEAWATHLKTTTERSSKLNESPQSTELKNILNEAWKCPHLLFEKTENCYHATRYGFQIYRKLKRAKDPQAALTKKCTVVLSNVNKLSGKYEQVAKSAVDYFELAIKMAPTMSPAAHVGVAYVLLKTRQNFPNLGNHHADHKINALDYLRKATEMLVKEISSYRLCQSLLSDPSKSLLAAQLADRTRALEAYAAVIEETSSTVELSLRPVEVTYKRVMDDTTYILWVTDGNSITAEELKQDFGIFDTENEIQLAFHGLKANKDLGYIYQAEDGVKLLYENLNLPDLKGNQPTVSLRIDGNDIRAALGVLEGPAFPELSDKDDIDKDEEKPATEISSFNVSSDYKPSFVVAFKSIKSWDDVVRKANAFRSNKETLEPYIVLRVTADMAEKFLASPDSPLASCSVDITGSMSEQGIPSNSGTAKSPLEWTVDLKPLTEKLQKPITASLSGFFHSPESCSALSKTNISRKTVPSNTSKQPVEHKTQLTIYAERLQDPALLCDTLIKNHIAFDVIFEGVHLEDDEVTYRCQQILQKSTQMTLRFPKLRHAEGMEKMADEITESVRSYCKMFREKGIRPTLEFGNLDSSLAKQLYENVNRVSDKIQQLNLTPLRDIKFESTPASEALRQIEQQGLLLVAKFMEKNAIPKKTIALVSSVAAAELVLGGTLLGLGLPFAGPLITMALQDVWKTYQVYKKREFSLVEFVVKKAIQAAKKGCGEVIGDWVSSYFSALRNASQEEMESIAIKQWDRMNPRTLLQAGGSVAAAFFFLYCKYGGRKKIVEAIKKQIRTITPQLKTPSIDENKFKDLLISFQATVSTGLNGNPDDELRNWFRGLNQVDLLSSDFRDGFSVVDWAALQDSVAETETNFGTCLLYAIQKVVARNFKLYFTLGYVTLIKEFKTHCFKLAMIVLLISCQFEPHEADIVSSQLNPKVASPVSEIRRALGTEMSVNLVETNRLKVAQSKFDEIGEVGPSAALSVESVLLHVREYLMERLQASNFVTRLIQDSVSTKFDENAMTAKIILSSSPETAVSPIQTSSLKCAIWEHCVIRRLMQTVGKIYATGEFSCSRFEDSSSAQLASLILYLHEKCVDAALVGRDDYEKLKAQRHGNFGVTSFIVYKTSLQHRLLEPLTVVHENTEESFSSPDLILKALNFICGDTIEDIRSFDALQKNTEKGRKMHACLSHCIEFVAMK